MLYFSVYMYIWHVPVHMFCMGMYAHLFICVHTCVSHVYLCSCLCALVPVSWCLLEYVNVHSWSHPLCPLYTGSRIFLALTSTSYSCPDPAVGLPWASQQSLCPLLSGPKTAPCQPLTPTHNSGQPLFLPGLPAYHRPPCPAHPGA